MSKFNSAEYNKKVELLKEAMDKLNKQIPTAKQAMADVNEALSNYDVPPPPAGKSAKIYQDDKDVDYSQVPPPPPPPVPFGVKDASLSSTTEGSTVKFNWPVTAKPVFKQSFGTYYGSTSGWADNNANNYWFDDSNGGAFIMAFDPAEPTAMSSDELLNSVKKIWSMDAYSKASGNPYKFIKQQSGNPGDCLIMGSNNFHTSNLAFIWDSVLKSWTEVDYQDLVNWYNQQVGKHGYGAKEAPKVTYGEYTGASLSDSEIANLITGINYSYTLPKNPPEGTAWHEYAEIWQVYIGGKWVKTNSTVVNEHVEKKANKKKEEVKPAHGMVYKKQETKPKLKTKENKKTGSGLWFRGNCSQWHEIINPEKTVIASVNGKHKWFFSNISSSTEYNCQHDFKRIMPVFTDEEKLVKVEEIQKNQSSDSDTAYWIQIGQAIPKWKSVSYKQTIRVGNRAFHHNSSNKTWYICFTEKEMNGFKKKIEPSDIFKDEMDNIFVDALSGSKFGYSWFYDGTKEIEAPEDKEAAFVEAKLQEVATVAAILENKGNGKTKKPLVKDMDDPKPGNDYYFDDSSEYSSYIQIFDYIYENEYSFGQFQNKARQAHKAFMYDLKLAMLKKDKKRFTMVLEQLEILQDKFNEAEAHYVETDLPSHNWLKPMSKIQNMWNYHFENKYGEDK